MTKTPVPLHADDITVFARALSRQLGEISPSHLSLMNMVARAAGFQNMQHMRAASAAGRRLEALAKPAPVDLRSVERALFQFDELGRLRQWPSKRSVQTLALWALWSALPNRLVLHESEINDRLQQEHLFQDPATLRRTMIGAGLLTRQNDGSDYRRIEQEPPAEAKALIHVVSDRRRGRR